MELSAQWEDGAAREQALSELLAAEPHLAYRNFGPIEGRGGGALALQRRRWSAPEAQVLVVRDRSGRPLAALRVQHRTFESAHFARAVAGVDAPAAVAGEAERLSALRAAYAELVAALRVRGYAHLMASVSTQDRAAYRAVQEAGCFHVGTRISWMQSLTGAAAESELAAPLRIELHEREQIPRLPRASWRRLHEYCRHAFDRGPFVFDADVPLERATELYQVWTEKALTGEWCDALLVVRDGEEIIAFNAMLLLEDLSEAAGAGILGRGIGASLPGYRGLFTALQKECSARRPLGASYLENEAQASTIGSINVFGRLGHHCFRSTASFHRALQGVDPTGRAG